MSGVPKNMLKHFESVREECGIPISTQMKMHENGYRIAKAGEEFSDARLKCESHEILEYTGEDEYSLVGNIIAKDGEFCSAEIVDSIIININDINMLRAFLDEVEWVINDD